MADSPNIPGSHSRPLEADGRWRGEWWRFLNSLANQPSLSSDQSAAIASLAARVAELEAGGNDGDIQGLLSVAVSGTLADGLVQVALRGDSANPGALRYYGTDEDGTKGFHAMPEPEPQVFNRITADGDIRVTADGDLRITD